MEAGKGELLVWFLCEAFPPRCCDCVFFVFELVGFWLPLGFMIFSCGSNRSCLIAVLVMTRLIFVFVMIITCSFLWEFLFITCVL